MEGDDRDERPEKPPGQFMPDDLLANEPEARIGVERSEPDRDLRPANRDYGATVAQMTTTFRPQLTTCVLTSCADAVHVVEFAR